MRFSYISCVTAACVNLMYQQDTSLYMEASSAGNKQESEKTSYQLLLIRSLKKEIEMARKLDPEKLAADIRKIGFFCQHCGKCCKRAFGDNRVAVIPSEIERIREYTGLSKLEVAGPFVPETCIQNEARRMKKNVLKLHTGHRRKKKSRSLLNFLSLFRSVSIVRARFTLLDGYSDGRQTVTAFFLKEMYTNAGFIQCVLCCAALIPFISKS